MSGSKIRLPEGVSDRLPERARAVRMHNEAIAKVFELSGYELVDTPPFELLEVLEDGLGKRAKQALFRMIDPANGEIVVLRPDFTAQVARMVTLRMAERPRPLRLQYQGRVLRAADPLGRGMKSREMFQAGAELIGAEGRWADAEVLSLGVRALEHVGRAPVIDLGHAAIVASMIPAAVDEDEVHRALAVKDRARLSELAPRLASLADLFGDVEVLARARAELADAPRAVHLAIDELEVVARELTARLPGVRVSFDLGEERGLGYYTGVFFHGYVSGAADAVLMGGRYDGLLAKYGRSEPAVGLAIDVDAIARLLAPARERQGCVLAEHDLDRPSLLAEAELRRSRGERAVLVRADLAKRYAIANGYRAVVSRSAAGALVEEVVSGDLDR